MLIFTEKRIAILAVPKTGTTALEMALRPHADIVFQRNRNHMPAARFRNKVAPFLKDGFGIQAETIAVMREPEDQLRSWYKYRQSDRRAGHENSTAGMSFDQFIRDAISDNPPPHAGVGSQYSFLCDAKGRLLVHHLFAYEQMHIMIDFLQDRLGTKIELERRNVSPQVDAPLSDEMRTKLTKARSAEVDLYAKLTSREGYLEGEI